MIAENKKIKKPRRKDFYQNIFFSTIIGVVTLAIIGFLIVSDFRINKKRGEMTQQINALQKELQELQDKKAKLEAGISQAQNDAYWEGKVREQGYKKPGEEQVVVLPPQENQPTSTEKPKNFFEKFFQDIGF